MERANRTGHDTSTTTYRRVGEVGIFASLNFLFGLVISLQAQDIIQNAAPLPTPFEPYPAITGVQFATTEDPHAALQGLTPEPSASTGELESLSRRVAELEQNALKWEELAKQNGTVNAQGKPEGNKPEENKAEPSTNRDKWTVKLGGHVQADYVTWARAAPAISGPALSPGPTNYFEFRRLRLVADGSGYGVFDFRLQMTLEPETVGETAPLGTASSPDVKDAYLSMNDVPLIGRLRVGNFFVPFSLEQVTNDTNNIFLERSIPTQGVFSADREVGVAFYNCNESKDVTWCGGMFFDGITDTLKERIDDNQGYRLSGRVTCLPFYDQPSNGRYLLHTGMGILYTDDQDDRVRFRARPQIHEGPRLIDSGVLNGNTYTTGNFEAAVVCGPFTVQSEAFLAEVNSATNTTISGAYVHFSYFLTGENRVFERFGQHGAQFVRNIPNNNFFITREMMSLGAWELKTRWSLLDLSDAERGQYNDLTVGFNWYWSDRTRVMFDWIHPITSSQTTIGTAGSPMSTIGSTTSDILALRFDFNW